MSVDTITGIRRDAEQAILRVLLRDRRDGITIENCICTKIIKIITIHKFYYTPQIFIKKVIPGVFIFYIFTDYSVSFLHTKVSIICRCQCMCILHSSLPSNSLLFLFFPTFLPACFCWWFQDTISFRLGFLQPCQQIVQ